MGWLGVNNIYGTVDKYFDNNLSEGYKWMTGKGSMINGAYYRPYKNPQGDVICAVYLVKTPKNDKYKCDLYYKAMDETVNPFYYDCPQKILDMLTAPLNEWSREWREKCKIAQKRKKEVKALKEGDIIQFDRKFTFRSGREEDTFKLRSRYTANTKRLELSFVNNGQYVSLPGWRKMIFKKI